jgi:hypothetical protein
MRGAQRPQSPPAPHPAGHRTRCRASEAPSFAPVPPPDHPTFDLYRAVDAALEEDAGDFGDITTLST